ncbi:MAG TPA: four helix bundle protein [Nitrospiraceae bacterium]|nr:four helix bundle protein [Nitrospiraceae bacterium]
MGNDSARRNVVQEKSFAFAVAIVKAGRRLQLDRKEWVLSKQLIRAGTSIGANIEEAIAAQSKKDFLAKMSIALKEARETHYWLRILRDSGLTTEMETEAHLLASHELITLLSSITLTTRENLDATARARSLNRQNSTFHTPHSTLQST